MKPSFLISVVVAAIIAVVFFVLVPFLGSDISAQYIGAFAAFVGALAAPAISSLFSHETVDSESDNGASVSSGEISTLYVGNLPYRANEQAVQDHFSSQGQVKSVRLMKDRRTGKRKGYGFVEMDEQGAASAIKNLNDVEFQERTLKVRLAKEKSTEE